MSNLSGRRRIAILTAAVLVAGGVVGLTQISSASARTPLGCSKFTLEGAPAYYKTSADYKAGKLSFCSDSEVKATNAKLPMEQQVQKQRDIEVARGKAAVKKGKGQSKVVVPPVAGTPTLAQQGNNVDGTPKDKIAAYARFTYVYSAASEYKGSRAMCPAGYSQDTSLLPAGTPTPTGTKCVKVRWDVWLKGAYGNPSIRADAHEFLPNSSSVKNCAWPYMLKMTDTGYTACTQIPLSDSRF